MTSDITFMQEALKEAQSVKGKTSPNPAVGAIIVKDGAVIGRGATSPVGGPHAEVNAIESVTGSCVGATIYVTLEPCNHWGRTPPCSERIVKEGFSRVVIAILDPNPKVAGSGVKTIEDAGIEVSIGLLNDEAHRINEEFFYYIVSRRPWVTLKVAMTLDGKVADSSGSSKWITNERSRAFVHELRAKHSAIGVGRGTLESDNPKLNVRGYSGDDPIRVVFASTTDIGRGSYFREHAGDVKTIICVAGGVAEEVVLASDGVEYWYTGSRDYIDSFSNFLDMAYEREIDSLFIEGGASLIKTLLDGDFVNRLYIFYAPKIVGSGISGLTTSKTVSMADALNLKNVEFRELGDNFMVTGLLQN